MNAISKAITDLFKSLESHIPASLKPIIEMELTGFFLAKVDLVKFVGTLNAETFAALQAAVEARAAK